MLWVIDSAVLRGVLRVYFITFITLLGLIGSQCCKCAAKVDLLRGKDVKLNRMTGWLRLSDILTCIWKLRRLPGGVWLGLVMITTALLSTAADLAVAFLVVPVQGPGSCPFTEGLVMNWETPEVFNRPPANGYPALIASNVQIYSGNAGCDVGIYTKVPQNGDPSFCGRDIDVLGGWDCVNLDQDSSFDADVSVADIESSLVQANLQYSNYSGTFIYYNGGAEITHLAVWSSSTGNDNTGSTFDVLVSFDLTSSPTDTKVMRTYKCTANPTSATGQTAIPAILSQIQSVSTLSQWATGLEAILYEGANTAASQYAQGRLEQYLNSMTMVQGGSNSVLNTPIDDDFEYGCIVSKTKVAVGVFFLVIFTAFVLGMTTLYWIILLLIISKHALSRVAKRKSGVAVKNVKPVPDGVITWMLQAARENVQGSDTGGEGLPEKEGELRNWNYTLVDSNQGIARMVRTGGNVTTVVEESATKV